MFKIDLSISASLPKYKFLLQLATFSVNSSSIPPFAQNINLSVILDSSLPWSPHLIHQQILVALPAVVFGIQLLITASFGSKLPLTWGNSILTGLPASDLALLWPYQHNRRATLWFKILQWFSTLFRIKTRSFTMPQALHDLPHYLSDFIFYHLFLPQPTWLPRCSLNMPSNFLPQDLCTSYSVYPKLISLSYPA